MSVDPGWVRVGICLITGLGLLVWNKPLGRLIVSLASEASWQRTPEHRRHQGVRLACIVGGVWLTYLAVRSIVVHW